MYGLSEESKKDCFRISRNFYPYYSSVVMYGPGEDCKIIFEEIVASVMYSAFE